MSTEAENKKPYQVKNIKYGEKTVVGRVIGRKKTVIPEEEFQKLAELHCTWKEIADFYDVPENTLRDNFRDLYTKGTTITKQRLRQAQLKLALGGDRVMLIWLGKNLLGQQEAPQSSESEQVLPWLDDKTE
jgi:AraC-like DNA-binding protein